MPRHEFGIDLGRYNDAECRRQHPFSKPLGLLNRQGSGFLERVLVHHWAAVLALGLDIAVDTRNNDWRRGWGNDWRGWNDRYSGYDAGRFTCKVRYGRVVDLDYNGIRGL